MFNIEKKTENKNYYMIEIEAKKARELIIKYHYSHKVVPNSKLHLGVFDKKTNELVGVLQYGYPMNPKNTPGKLVENATKDEMFELNRMAMLDEAPKLSESQAIGLSIKYIKRYLPHIKWLLSFADGKEGNVGIIYQATNWDYYGYKISDSFYKLDDIIMHSVQIWHKYLERPNLQNMNTTYKEIHNVSRIHARQYIYIFRIDKNIKVLRDKESYPKKDQEPLITKELIYKRNDITLSKKEIINYI